MNKTTRTILSTVIGTVREGWKLPVVRKFFWILFVLLLSIFFTMSKHGFGKLKKKIFNGRHRQLWKYRLALWTLINDNLCILIILAMRKRLELRHDVCMTQGIDTEWTWKSLDTCQTCGQVMPVCQTYAGLWLALSIYQMSGWLVGWISNFTMTENSSLLLGQIRRMSNDRWNHWMNERSTEWVNEWISVKVCHQRFVKTLKTQLTTCGCGLELSSSGDSPEDWRVQENCKAVGMLRRWGRILCSRDRGRRRVELCCGRKLGGGWRQRKPYLTPRLRFRTSASDIFVSAPNISRSHIPHLCNEEVCSFQLW